MKNNMDLKIEMLKSRILHDKNEEVHQTEHAPDERRLVFRTVSYEIEISGDLYDTLESIDTMYGVLDVYDSVNYQ